MGNRGKKRKKKGLPVFESDLDLFREFAGKDDSEKTGEEDLPEPVEGQVLNKHGLPFLQELPGDFSPPETEFEEEPEEDFQALLEESFKQPVKKTKIPPRPVPLRRRLKRYPGPEIELDLHGFTALGAQVKARSFILSCKQQGYFTLRLIVGKGLHSDLGPVLPDVVEDLLQDLKKEDIVLSFQWDRRKKSKSGAVIVFLKQFRD